MFCLRMISKQRLRKTSSDSDQRNAKKNNSTQQQHQHPLRPVSAGGAFLGIPAHSAPKNPVRNRSLLTVPQVKNFHSGWPRLPQAQRRPNRLGLKQKTRKKPSLSPGNQTRKTKETTQIILPEANSRPVPPPSRKRPRPPWRAQACRHATQNVR